MLALRCARIFKQRCHLLADEPRDYRSMAFCTTCFAGFLLVVSQESRDGFVACASINRFRRCCWFTQYLPGPCCLHYISPRLLADGYILCQPPMMAMVMMRFRVSVSQASVSLMNCVGMPHHWS